MLQSETKQEQFPPAVFGQLPGGFELGNQSIEMLMHSHRKAQEAIKNLPPNVTDEVLDATCEVERSIYSAILDYMPKRVNEVAYKLRIMVEKADFKKCDSVEEILCVNDLRRLYQSLEAATAPVVPKKKVGSLARKKHRSGNCY
jgi:hypothetical protein